MGDETLKIKKDWSDTVEVSRDDLRKFFQDAIKNKTIFKEYDDEFKNYTYIEYSLISEDMNIEEILQKIPNMLYELDYNTWEIKQENYLMMRLTDKYRDWEKHVHCTYVRNIRENQISEENFSFKKNLYYLYRRVVSSYRFYCSSKYNWITSKPINTGTNERWFIIIDIDEKECTLLSA